MVAGYETPGVGTNVVVGAYIYKVVSGGVGLVDDRAGNMRYDPLLQVSDFSVRIYRNDLWYDMTDADRKAINDKCLIGWTTGAVLDYSRGTTSAEKMYSKDDYGLNRERFKGF